MRLVSPQDCVRMRVDRDKHFKQQRKLMSGNKHPNEEEGIYINVDNNTVSKMSKQEYEKTAEKVFLHLQKNLNNKTVPQGGSPRECSLLQSMISRDL